MTRLYDLWPPHAYRFKTALQWIDPLSPVSVYEDLKKKSSNPAAAIDSLPIPVPQTPITSANEQVLAAQKNFEQQTAGQKTVSDTILAGNTGGYYKGEPGSPGFPGPGVKSYKGRGF
jgi:hypothetical protein